MNNLEPNSTILGARAGDTLSVRDLYALLLQSANEVANALAEHCSGDIESFAELMNRKAESLGCTDSHFANPSGLNDEKSLYLRPRYGFDRPGCVQQSDLRRNRLHNLLRCAARTVVQYPDGWRHYAHHRMMKNDSVYYDGIIGGKTGYTSLAGNTLVTCAERDGLKLITVVLNGHQTHYDDTKALLISVLKISRPLPSRIKKIPIRKLKTI